MKGRLSFNFKGPRKRYRSKKKPSVSRKKQKKKPRKQQQNYEKFKLRTRQKLSSSYAYVKRLGFGRWKRKPRGSAFGGSWRGGGRRRKREGRGRNLLRQMGVCVAGFRWIKQGGGYRCVGGSHWVDDSQLGI
jgi:hypothetical protein